MKLQRVASVLNASFHEYLVKNRILGDKVEEQQLRVDATNEFCAKLDHLFHAKDPSIRVNIQRGLHGKFLMLTKQIAPWPAEHLFVTVSMVLDVAPDTDHIYISKGRLRPLIAPYVFSWPNIPYDKIVDTVLSVFNLDLKTASAKKWQTAENAAKTAWDRR